MWLNNNANSRRSYEEAFEILVFITNALLALVAIIILALSVGGFFFTFGSVLILVTGIASFLGFIFVIFLNFHFLCVVKTYAKHGDGDGNYSVFA